MALILYINIEFDVHCLLFSLGKWAMFFSVADTVCWMVNDRELVSLSFLLLLIPIHFFVYICVWVRNPNFVRQWFGFYSNKQFWLFTWQHTIKTIDTMLLISISTNQKCLYVVQVAMHTMDKKNLKTREKYTEPQHLQRVRTISLIELCPYNSTYTNIYVIDSWKHT